jgi:Mrp family chromosome partitioning ATPase
MTTALQRRMQSVKHKILILSGKGGVGKSSISTQLAFTLSQNYRVGILDIDLCGPSVPKILGIHKRQVFQCSEGWVPVYVDPTHNEKSKNSLCCMSIAFLLQNEDDAVVWRGPKKHAMIRQFLEDVYWADLDVLIIDTPPGTSDEHISIAEMFKDITLDGSIIVTTPQGVALADVRKELNFCRKLKIPILGIVENMSGYACPCCHEITYIFGKGGGQELSAQFNVPLLGSVPIDPQLGNAEDEGIDFVKTYPSTTSAVKLREIADRVANLIQLSS